MLQGIDRMLQGAIGRRGWLTLLACATPLVYVVSAIQPAPAQSPQVTAPTPYERWLNEEVVYIISEEERKAFLDLHSDAERGQFIEQFWQRRDPTPGTEKNEFREEHYRRIAYANEHFPDKAGNPGWEMDRGMIYIKYGPPDEKDSHPAGPYVTFDGRTFNRPPWERWRYKHIEGIGNNVTCEFLDHHGDGKYQLSQDNE